MTLLPDWKEISRKAWSMRFMAITAVCAGAGAVLAFVTPDMIPLWAIFALVTFFTLAGLVSRVMDQNLRKGAE